MNRESELRKHIDEAWRNAKGAETAGRYDWASYWESRAEQLIEELKEVSNNG